MHAQPHDFPGSCRILYTFHGWVHYLSRLFFQYLIKAIKKSDGISCNECVRLKNREQPRALMLNKYLGKEISVCVRAVKVSVPSPLQKIVNGCIFITFYWRTIKLEEGSAFSDAAPESVICTIFSIRMPNLPGRYIPGSMEKHIPV